MHGEEERAGEGECERREVQSKLLHKRQVTAPTSQRRRVARRYEDKKEVRAYRCRLICHSGIRVNESDKKNIRCWIPLTEVSAGRCEWIWTRPQSFPLTLGQRWMKFCPLVKGCSLWLLSRRYPMYLFNIMQIQLYAPLQSNQRPVFPLRDYQSAVSSIRLYPTGFVWMCMYASCVHVRVCSMFVCMEEWVSECARGGGNSFRLWCLALTWEIKK